MKERSVTEEVIDYLTHSTCQHLGKCIENNVDNMPTDVTM